MKRTFSWVGRVLGDLPLRPTIAIALVLGMAIPVAISVSRELTERHGTLLGHLHEDHQRFVEVLAIGMETPMWDRRPETGQPLIDALMQDERIVSITVAEPPNPKFLVATAPDREQGDLLVEEGPVIRNGQEIGRVRVQMSTARLEGEIGRQTKEVLLTGLLQLALGVLIVFPLLRFKVLDPVDVLVKQTRVLADGGEGPGKAWIRRDELGVLGRTIEETGSSLSALVTDLENRNKELQQRESELASTTGTLRVILDNMTDGISLVDSDLRLQAWNQRFVDLMSFPEDVLRLGETIDSVISGHLDNRGYSRLEAQPILDGVRGSFQPGELSQSRYRTLEDRDIEVRRSPVPGGGFVSTYTDITERLRAETETQRWVRLFRDALASLADGFAVYDAARRIVICNSAYADLYGLPADNMVGMTVAEIQPLAAGRIKTIDRVPASEAGALPGRDADEIWAFWKEQDDPLEMELKDGRWMLVTRHPTAEGGFVFVRTDITDLKRMQDALRENEALIRSVLEAAPIPISMTRLHDGAVVYESPASKALFLRGADAKEGDSTLNYFLHPGDRSRFVARLMTKGAVEGFEVEMKKGDGSVFWAAISARMMEHKGEEVVVSGTLDLTERRETEAEMGRQRDALYQSEKLNALGGLLAGVAHELNNPLSVVVGQALVLQEHTTDPDIRARAEKIGSAASRCARIVKTFLAMARQSEPQRSEVSLNDVIETALEVTGYGLRSADIDVRRHLDPGLPKVWGDPDQLAQVAMNLIVNAQQAMAGSGDDRALTLTTTADPGKGEVRLEVRDSGPGIPEEDRPRIFDPFFTTKDVGVGTGVGLAISLGIVQAHGGSIVAGGAGPRGAVFTITLPVSESHDEQAEQQVAKPDSRTRRRVLVVDDEIAVSGIVADILELDGHDVTVAESGNAALRLLAEQSFDVVLSDLRMADLDGPGLYRRIAEDYPRLARHVGFMTGDALGQVARAFLDGTSQPYLEKPFTPDEIRDLFRRALDAEDADSAGDA